MGNSTIRLQSIVDSVRSIGELNPIFPAGGFSVKPALDIANDVLTDMLAQPFNWKWNRSLVTPFLTNTWQQDYASALKNIGWLEHGIVIDINNTSIPKPIFWLRVVRDLERTAFQFGPSQPQAICWLPNDQLTQGTWPGIGVTYTNPLGQPSMPNNPLTNILDANGNILVLTTYGITGAIAPVLPANSAAGLTVNDGTCVWTVVDPKAQGFRLSPLPSQSGIVYQVNLVAQAKPPRFTSLQQLLDPVPDDCEKYFRTGFIAYAHRQSPNPSVQAKFEIKKSSWFQDLREQTIAADREPDSAGFIPDRGVMQSSLTVPIGPAWPFGPYGQGN